MSKICSKCGVDKPFTDFYKDKNIKDGYHQWCKVCKIESRRQWRKSESNLQKDRVSCSKWRQTNKEYLSQKYIKTKEEKPNYYSGMAKKSRLKRGSKYLQYRRIYDKNKREIDSLYKLRRATSNLIARSITHRYTKNSICQSILGIDWLLFKSHIESGFTHLMSWGNYGEWHIDHICPCSQAQNEEELIKLQHYTNLRPMWAMHNLIKGDSKTEEAKSMCIKLLNREWIDA